MLSGSIVTKKFFKQCVVKDGLIIQVRRRCHCGGVLSASSASGVRRCLTVCACAVWAFVVLARHCFNEGDSCMKFALGRGGTALL